MKYVEDLRKLMVDKKLILIYEGTITHDIMVSLTKLAGSKLDALEEEFFIKKKVVNVMVESLQNIVRHYEQENFTPPLDPDVYSPVFLMGKRADEYILASGNPILNEDGDILRDKLKNINDMEKSEIRKLYREIIQNMELSSKGGAGLGFLDMARRSGQKLQFGFEAIDENHSFFYMMTIIKVPKEAEEISNMKP